MMNRPTISCSALTLAVALGTIIQTTFAATDPSVIAVFRNKDIEVTEAKGEIAGLNIKSPQSLTSSDLAQIRSLPHLKTLITGSGLEDAHLKAIEGLSELESFSNNGMVVSDSGIGSLSKCQSLRTVTLFHPGKNFSGKGLETLPNLESLTVAGSTDFADEGMAAVEKLVHLKGFRSWHTGITIEGIRKLKSLKELKSVTLGQRLAYKPPTSVSDESVTVLAECLSLENITLQEARLSLPALLKLKQLPALKKLNLDGIEISDADLIELRKQMPRTEIKWTAPTEIFSKRIKALFDPR